MLEFLHQAWWPALLAGVVAIGVTMAIERWGGTLGGLLGTLPTTIVPASLGIHATAPSTSAFVAAMCAVPAGMLLDAGFLYLWRVLPPRLPEGWTVRRQLLTMVLLSLLFWVLMALVVVLALDRLKALGPAVMWWVGGGAMTVLVGFGAWACVGRPPSPRGSREVGVVVLLSRGVLAGVAIAGAIGLSMLGGDVASGMASVFPAIFLTTMVSLWLSQDSAVQAGAVGPMMLGSSSVCAFALLAAGLCPWLGVGWGVALAWPLAVLTTTLPSWAVLSGRLFNRSSQVT